MMRTKKSSLLKSIACIVVMILMLTSCGQQRQDTTSAEQTSGSRSSEEHVTIRYWTHENPTFVQIAKQFAKEYMDANPNVTIEHEAFTDYSTKFYVSMAAGIEADIMEYYGSPIRFAKGDVLLPVDESIIPIDELEKSFSKSALANRMYNGKYYGIPEEVNIESPGLLVNTALLREQGVEIPQSWKDNLGPATWSELMEVAKKLTKIENGTMTQAGLGVVGGEEVSMFLSLIWQLGGDYRDEENKTVNFETEEAKTAIDFIKNLIKGPDCVHDILFSGRFDGFKEGTIAMAIGAPWATAVLEQDMPDFEYEYYNLPAFIEGSDPYFVGEGGWGPIVSARTQYPDECWSFVKYITSAEKQLEWAKTTGCIPARVDIIDDEYFTSGAGKKAIYPAMQILQYAKDPGAYTLDPFMLVWDVCYKNVNTILAGQVSTEAGLANMQKDAVEMIERLQKTELFEDIEDTEDTEDTE